MIGKRKKENTITENTDKERDHLNVEGNDSITDESVSTDEDILTDTQPAVEDDGEENERPDGMRK